MEEKVYKSNQISLEMLEKVKNCEAHIHNQEIYTRNLEFALGHYNPVKSDPIDCELADYINTQLERPALNALFVREQEGVYSFGSKKTNIKLEQGLLKVRVGGGYLSIQEFCDQYLPLEFEKLGGWERLNPNSSMYVGGERYSPGRHSPGRNASPNTRKSNNIRQSVSLQNLKGKKMSKAGTSYY